MGTMGGNSDLRDIRCFGGGDRGEVSVADCCPVFGCVGAFFGGASIGGKTFAKIACFARRLRGNFIFVAFGCASWLADAYGRSAFFGNEGIPFSPFGCPAFAVADRGRERSFFLAGESVSVFTPLFRGA